MICSDLKIKLTFKPYFEITLLANCKNIFLKEREPHIGSITRVKILHSSTCFRPFNEYQPVKMQWGLMKQSVILPHKFTANTLWTRSFHDHDFDTFLDNLQKINELKNTHYFTDNAFLYYQTH